MTETLSNATIAKVSLHAVRVNARGNWLFLRPERIVAGQLELPAGPGLGAQLNESLLAEHGFDPLA